MTNAENSQYLVSFLITQRGDYIGWIQEVLKSGLREGETLDIITFTKLEGLGHETSNFTAVIAL